MRLRLGFGLGLGLGFELGLGLGFMVRVKVGAGGLPNPPWLCVAYCEPQKQEVVILSAQAPAVGFTSF